MIVVAGEALVDVIARAEGTVVAVPGGGPFNAARAIGRLGVPVSFAGALSTDEHGDAMARSLAADGVSLELIQRPTCRRRGRSRSSTSAARRATSSTSWGRRPRRSTRRRSSRRSRRTSRPCTSGRWDSCSSQSPGRSRRWSRAYATTRSWSSIRTAGRRRSATSRPTERGSRRSSRAPTSSRSRRPISTFLASLEIDVGAPVVVRTDGPQPVRRAPRRSRARDRGAVGHGGRHRRGRGHVRRRDARVAGPFGRSAVVRRGSRGHPRRRSASACAPRRWSSSVPAPTRRTSPSSGAGSRGSRFRRTGHALLECRSREDDRRRTHLATTWRVRSPRIGRPVTKFQY